LEYDNELDASAGEPPSDLHNFAKAGMKTVGDPGFSRLFAGSMSQLRGEVATHRGCRSDGRSRDQDGLCPAQRMRPELKWVKTDASHRPDVFHQLAEQENRKELHQELLRRCP
jgi:hypothetical protein